MKKRQTIANFLLCATLFTGGVSITHHADAKPSSGYSSRSSSGFSRSSSSLSSSRPSWSSSGYGGSSRISNAPKSLNKTEQRQVNAISGSSYRDYETAKAAKKQERAYNYSPPPVQAASTPAPEPQYVNRGSPQPQNNRNDNQYRYPNYRQDSGPSPLTTFGAGMLAEHLINGGNHTAQAAPAPVERSSRTTPSYSDDTDTIDNDFGGGSDDVKTPSSSVTQTTTSIPPATKSFGASPVRHNSGGGIIFFLFMVLLAVAVVAWLIWNSKEKEKKNSRNRGNGSGSLMSGRVQNNAETNVETAGTRVIALGSSVVLPTLPFMNAPNATDDEKLHFEPGEKGQQSVMAVGSKKGLDINSTPDEMEIYVSPDGSREDFIVLEPKEKEARFFSWIDTVSPGSRAEWDEWLNDENGIMGLPSFQTKDGTEWSRVLMSGNPHRLSPTECWNSVVSQEGETDYSYHSMLYVRDTGWSAPYSDKEYLLVRIELWKEDGNTDAAIKLYAGVDVPWSSLGLD
mgnify:CR=1 FL=1